MIIAIIIGVDSYSLYLAMDKARKTTPYKTQRNMIKRSERTRPSLIGIVVAPALRSPTMSSQSFINSRASTSKKLKIKILPAEYKIMV
ncbi:MAG: hypothetical protein UZ08_BCD001002804 [Candidatus Parvibacillus calidus]|nr:MAG: hypothetical protein UZ08_BCD001002804 [Candidatus Parvibacillus calidus]